MKADSPFPRVAAHLQHPHDSLTISSGANVLVVQRQLAAGVLSSAAPRPGEIAVVHYWARRTARERIFHCGHFPNRCEDAA
jgi:hypothetical protein